MNDLGKLESVHTRHGYINYQYIELRLIQPVESLPSRSRFENDLNSFLGFFENGPQSVSEDLMVVYQSYPYARANHLEGCSL